MRSAGKRKSAKSGQNNDIFEQNRQKEGDNLPKSAKQARYCMQIRQNKVDIDQQIRQNSNGGVTRVSGVRADDWRWMSGGKIPCSFF